ncbi:hypothetical protein ALT_4872 [Aspergillus lentulus]|uniref:AMP-dependent synthetase/ligase domain-containing protein n=1 Tax=Aspergillus lentulus TaxID=293939 RepID=A0AAN4TB45_ASPLE|nr:hypothetical protein ALT_4872 [Aspergillus lentulus]
MAPLLTNTLDCVDLSLSYSGDMLLSDFISQYQGCLGLQGACSPNIITLLNVSWMVTVRCFSPAPDICLGLHSEPGLYFITRLAHGGDHHVSAVGLNCEVPVKTLVRDMAIVQFNAARKMPAGYDASDESSEKFLSTTICYAKEIYAAIEGPTVCSWDGDLTYAQLDDMTSRLGQFLARIGVGRGTFIISCFEKSTWAIVARLAIMKAGAAYISIDATDPPTFLENVIRRVNAKIMLVSSAYQARYTPFISSVIAITGEMVRALPLSTEIVCPLVKPSDACLILFTSGSTGEPKGIIQEHQAYATAVRDYIALLGMGQHSRVLQFDDYAFDISNNDYLTTLTAGGCCCVPTPPKAISALVENINSLQVNMTFLTPTVAAQFSPQDVPTLQVVCMGGEPMSNELLMRWAPHVRLVNQYGMGEAATFCAYNDQIQLGQNAIVGRSGSGAIWITNPESPELLMPVGAVGEILIEGPHLARGYLDGLCQRPDVGFLPDAPIWFKGLQPSRAASRFYRSGDLGRYTHSGTVEHLGRKDTLLKINGCRVESTEVEYILHRSLGPGDAVIVDVLGAVDDPQEPFLVAFLCLANSKTNFLDTASNDTVKFLPVTSDHHSAHQLVQGMRADVMATLPVHMIPQCFILISHIPRTKSNKTDRRKLHHLAQKWYSSGALTEIRCN